MVEKDGWIGVDLDGTLAHYDPEKPFDPEHIGEPVAPMVERVKWWLEEGAEVRIFTARVAASGGTSPEGIVDGLNFADEQRRLVEGWCEQVFGRALRVTAIKDFRCLEIWDDRAVRVKRNTGELEVKAMTAVTPLTVTRAAILGKDGRVFSVEPPGRHHDVIRAMFEQGERYEGGHTAGFLLSDGTFADRLRAKQVAREAGQLLPRAMNLPELYSEDVW